MHTEHLEQRYIVRLATTDDASHPCEAVQEALERALLGRREAWSPNVESVRLESDRGRITGRWAGTYPGKFLG